MGRHSGPPVEVPYVGMGRQEAHEPDYLRCVPDCPLFEQPADCEGLVIAFSDGRPSELAGTSPGCLRAIGIAARRGIPLAQPAIKGAPNA